MTLYIVDDEETVREGIQKFVPWPKTRIDLVLTAKNGQDALEKMESVPPDILLTDVCMPKMNGVALARDVHGRYPDCVIIFMSGYTDTEYLKTAISVGALEYIEKPMEAGKILAVVLDAQERHLRKERQLLEFNALVEEARMHSGSIHSEWLRQFFLYKGDVSRIGGARPGNLERFLTSPAWTAIRIECFWPRNVAPESRQDARRRLMELLSKVAGFDSSICGFIDEQTAVWLSDFTPDQSFLGELEKTVSGNGGFFSMSVGPARRDLVELSADVSRIGLYARLRLFDGKTLHHVPKDSAPSEEFPSVGGTAERIAEAIAAADEQTAAQLLSKLKETVLNGMCPDSEAIDRLYESIRERILGAIQKERPGIYALLGELTEACPPGVMDFGDYSAFHEDFKDKTNALFRAMETGDSVEARIAKVMRYIRQNYGDPNLSVDSLAEEFELSGTYLCSIFKKSANVTIHQFITDIRIQNAIRLLQDTNDKVYEIAVKVGFLDTNYFSVFFKKQTGIAPNKYRK